MSGYDAFASFVNYMTTQLNGSGIAVQTEKDTTIDPPYLILQMGPENIRSKWLSAQMLQGWVVTARNDTEPLVVTMENVMSKVLHASQDVGSLEKYDYSGTQTKVTGSYIPEVFQISKDMSNDPKRARRIITWVLHSNAK